MNENLLLTGNTLNLRRLVWLRIIVLIAEVLAAWAAVSRWDLHLSLSPLIMVWTIVTAVSILTLLRLRLQMAVSDVELFIQLTFEVGVLTALLYFSGGSTNPFAPFFLLPLTLTAVSLPGMYTWAVMVLTLACYTTLLFFNVPLPSVHGGHAGHGADFRLHVLGMWFGFLLSAVLIAAFAVRMAATVRHRDQMIAKMHEQQLRNERVLALGTLAAGAAHELGTPLSTMAILLKDIDIDHPISEQKLDTLRSQVSRCKDILNSISASAGELRAQSGSVRALDDFLENLLNHWRSSRLDISLKKSLQGSKPAPSIVVDQTLEQALINILNNAADASPQDVEVSAQWTKEELVIDVGDRGEGLSPEIANKAGSHTLSTKRDGLGLGLFLSYTTLQRLGGEVHLFNRDGGGVICNIRLPLGPIRVSSGYDASHRSG